MSRMKQLLVPLIFWLGAVAPVAAENTSTYTPFDLDRCKQTEKPDEYVFGGSWRCKGIPGYDIFQSGMDARNGAGFGKSDEDNCALRKTFSPFNTSLSPIEWRFKGKTPIAAIERWSVIKDPSSGTNESVTWLVVNKLHDGTSCHMHYVSGSFPEANAAARKAADEKAESFNCETDKPTYDSTIGEPPISLEPCKVLMAQ